jgi:hypothetical protein
MAAPMSGKADTGVVEMADSSCRVVLRTVTPDFYVQRGGIASCAGTRPGCNLVVEFDVRRGWAYEQGIAVKAEGHWRSVAATPDEEMDGAASDYQRYRVTVGGGYGYEPVELVPFANVASRSGVERYYDHNVNADPMANYVVSIDTMWGLETGPEVCSGQ